MKRILIVEDDFDIRTGLKWVLSDKYEILEASNGYEALQILSWEAVDLVLLDMFMPVLDGVGVLQEMAAKAISIPVIAMTAQKDMKDQSKVFGVKNALIKPFDLAELERCIAQVFEYETACPPLNETQGDGVSLCRVKVSKGEDEREDGSQNRSSLQLRLSCRSSLSHVVGVA